MRRHHALLPLFILLTGGCASSAPPAEPVVDEAQSSVSPGEALNAMDPRTPVPLQPMMAWHQKQNMQEHLVAIAGITAALSREDWAGVSEAARLIASSPSMQAQCDHMGKGAEGFTELALEFHRRADQILVAAAAEEATAVLSATAHTLDACTGCHATYKQDVVDSAEWDRRVTPSR